MICGEEKKMEKKQEPIRVLQIVGRMDRGGIETMIMNLYRNIDRNKVQFDFLAHYGREAVYNDEIRRMGGRIYEMPALKDDTHVYYWRLFSYIRALNHFFKEHKEYRVIHGHMTNTASIYMPIAKKHGVTCRIAHSHNSENMGSFLVMATQNPIEQEGTYPLPEAQVDRFMLKVIIDYPKLEEEKKIIRQNITGEKIEVRPILKATDIMEARKVVRQVYLDEKIEQYIADIVFATRFPEKYDLKELKDMIGFGGSPRASINLALAARSYAFIKRRGYVIPEDVRAVAHDVLRHRIGLTYEAEAMNMSSDEIVSKILNKVEVP